MKITDEAKVMLEEVLTSNGYDCLKATVQKTCCGTSVMFNLAKLTDSDKPIDINGISVLMNDDVKNRTETITITVENKKLAVEDTAASGCCC